LIADPVRSIAIVGPGRVGKSLRRALERASAQSVACLGRSDDPGVLRGASAVILTVPDDVIGAVFASLVERGAITSDQVVLHCSGLVTADVLGTAQFAPLGRAAMHPMLAFADVDRAIEQLPGTTFGIDGDEVGLAAARAIVALLGGRAVIVPAEARAHYHLACVMASNGLVALTDMAEQIMLAGGVQGEGLGEGLAHLVEGTAGNMARLGVLPAMTGPVVRADTRTVQTHLRIMGAGSAEILQAYKVLMIHLASMAKKDGRVTPGQYRAIMDLLGNQTA
jgi:predicted short-subunit dehydrogenase-like oxidoreductase (DUF2520 family)